MGLTENVVDSGTLSASKTEGSTPRVPCPVGRRLDGGWGGASAARYSNRRESLTEERIGSPGQRCEQLNLLVARRRLTLFAGIRLEDNAIRPIEAKSRD